MNATAGPQDAGSLIRKVPLRISVVIRFKEEADYLPIVFEALTAQTVPGAEVRIIGVDNGSRDNSRTVAERFCDQVLEIDEYMPGAALNLALDCTAFDYAAVLSGHTVPASDRWLKALLSEAQKTETLAVYGAQLYPIHSRFLDKRDLDIFSTLKPRIEVRDADFWNANAMFPRASWEKLRFDERAFELEDHYWTKCLLDGTNCVRFVPSALVYHYTHISRNDRVYDHPRAAHDAERHIRRALETLLDLEASWPATMMAALTVKSMKDHPAALEALPALTRLLAEHWDFDVRWRVAGTLAKLPDSQGIEALITLLGDPSFYARDEAAWALAEIGASAASRLLKRLDTVPQREWPLAALALGRSGYPEAEDKAVALIERGLRETRGTLRLNYLYAAGEIEGARRAPALAQQIACLLDDADPELRAVAAWTAGSLASRCGDLLRCETMRWHAMYDPDPMVRVEAVAAISKNLAGLGDQTHLKVVKHALEDSYDRVRYVAAQAARLSAQNDGPAIPTDHAADADFGVRFEHWLRVDGLTGRAKYGSAVPPKR